MEPEHQLKKTKVRENKKPHSNKTEDKAINIIATLIAIPVYALIIGFFVAIVLIIFGWKVSEGGWWIPFLLAFPISIGVAIYSSKHPTSRVKKRGTYYKNSSGSSEGDSGWYPGCPEEGMLSSMDDMFDYDGDGHLDAFESSSKYDSFFGDDE